MKYSNLKSNNSNNSFQNQNAYNLTSYYPYGELPLKYTKKGQAQLKKELEEGSNEFRNASKLEKEFNKKYNNESQTNNKNNQPKQKHEDNKNFNIGGNFDLNSILPLLGNFGGGNDIIKQIMPLLNGNGNLKIGDLIKLFTSIKPKTTTQTATIETTNTIDSLKKVE